MRLSNLKISLLLTLSVTLAVPAVAALSGANLWTTWSRKPLVIGLIELFNMRKSLEDHNLFDTGGDIGPITCPPSTKTARTADGTCNDLDHPEMGAAGMRFGRNVPIASSAPDTDHLLDPNPRQISIELLTRDKFKEVSYLNLLATAWIQFMVHDWFSHGENELALPYVLPPPDVSADPLGIAGGYMLVPRSKIDHSHDQDRAGQPPTFRNENTHWFDASQIYASNLQLQNQLREFSGGRFLLTDKGRIPLDANGVERTGFVRNWWLGLSLMHTLFVLEHNSIAQMLASKHPDWTDQQLFDTARLINVAQIAKIHTLEWTPAILPNNILAHAMQANWNGDALSARAGGDPNNPFSQFLALVGGQKKLHGVPYSLTEEFTSVYRMHPLLPESLSLRHLDHSGTPETVPLVETRDEKSHAVSDRYELRDLFYSFGTVHPGALTLQNYPAFLQNLKIPLVQNFSFGNFDMGAVDILRDRERGVPRYNQFRRLVGLQPLQTFAQLSSDPIIVAKLNKVYGGDVEKLDLLIGCLAESYRPLNFGFGETAFQIFVVMASRRLEADRFFTTDYTAAVYTQEGLDWVSQSTMKSVLLRHFPELAAPMANVTNAFNPWQN